MPVTRKTILVREQELLISIGLHPHEKIAPQRLLVSVEVELENVADEEDQISATFDYDEIHAFITSQERHAHRLLQETVARRILDFLLAKPGVTHAMVETRKPDVFDDAAYVGVRLEGRR